MPRAETNMTPRGQSYGAKKQQESFTSQARASRPDPIEIEEDPPDRPIPIEGLGDASEILFAPTDRPAEDPRTGLGTYTAVKPSPDMFLLSQDPELSPALRTTLMLASLVDLLPHGD